MTLLFVTGDLSRPKTATAVPITIAAHRLDLVRRSHEMKRTSPPVPAELRVDRVAIGSVQHVGSEVLSPPLQRQNILSMALSGMGIAKRNQS